MISDLDPLLVSIHEANRCVGSAHPFPVRSPRSWPPNPSSIGSEGAEDSAWLPNHPPAPPLVEAEMYGR